MRSRYGRVRALALLASLVLMACLIVRLLPRDAGSVEGPPRGIASTPPATSGIGRAADTVPVKSEPVQEFGSRAPVDASHVAVAEDAASSGEALVVKVTTRKSKSETVPALPIAIGLGPPLDPSAPIFARAVTDATGRATFAIPWHVVEAALAQQGSELWVRVVAPGWQQSTTGGRPPAKRRALDISVWAARGVTLRGRVFDSQDQPALAQIRLRPAQGDRSERTGRSRKDGWFEVDVGQAGDYDLIADAGDLGTGALRGVSIGPEEPREPVTLRVHGPGILRGHVRDASGAPAAGLELLVLVASLDGKHDAARIERVVDIELGGRGRYWANLETGADGSFEVRGLREDHYVIRARTGPKGFDYPWLLATVPVESDGEPFVLQFDRPHLAVRLQDPDGRAWPDAALFERGNAYVGPLSEWPEKVTIAVAPLREETNRRGAPSTNPTGRRVGDEYVFEVEASKRYLVGLLGGGQPWLPIEVTVGEEAARVEVALTVRSEGLHGELSVSVLDRDGRPIGTGVAVQIEHAASAMPLLRSECFDDDWPKRFRLPEGEYHLVVEGDPLVDFHHGVLMRPSRHGRFETNVRIEAEREARVEATLPAGAKLHLRLIGEIREEDREAIRTHYEGFHLGGPLDDWAGSASLRLLAEGRWAEAALFTKEMTGSSAAGTHLTTELPLGSDQTSQILPAGSYTLEARLPGGRVAWAPVVLVDGETSEMTLILD